MEPFPCIYGEFHAHECKHQTLDWIPVTDANQIVGFISLFVLLIATIVATLLARRISRPLTSLAQKAHALAYSQAIPVTGQLE